MLPARLLAAVRLAFATSRILKKRRQRRGHPGDVRNTDDCYVDGA